jgi:hypothetical protein
MAELNPAANPPLGADDPRISEWLDGRLAPSEAAEVERAVAASPELTLLVEDLRTIQKAMRTTNGDAPPVDLGDRIMAAIASSSGGIPRVAAAMGKAAPTPSTGTGRRLPWLGLLGALAAGVLVTVVINLPNDNGREVALAPAPHKDREAFGRGEARRESLDELKGQVPSEALPTDALAANASPSPTLEKSLEERADGANDESISLAAGGSGRPSPQFSAAPASPPPAAARQVAKRAKVDLAGVLVIAVTNASERRTLDRLVAESGLEATPEKDHLALVGKATDVDAFLLELTRVGLVSAVPARRAAEAGKLKADERGDARNTTLIVRVVERKGKQPVSVQAGEAEPKP